MLIAMTDDRNRRSIRLQGFDYRNGGRYFVTICTKDRQCLFGTVRNGIMGLSDAGCIVADFWQRIPDHFPDVMMDIFVIMPDHMHGILCMPDISHRRGMACHAPTDHIERKFAQPIAGSLSTIIGQFKSACTKRIRTIDPTFMWQRNYYERIIRGKNEYARIYGYILRNPMNWKRNDPNL